MADRKDDVIFGNRSALDWVIDQYRVSTDKRSAITNDPNREDETGLHFETDRESDHGQLRNAEVNHTAS